MKLILITMKQANEFVLQHHSRHGKVQGCKFCIGVTDEEENCEAPRLSDVRFHVIRTRGLQRKLLRISAKSVCFSGN